MLVVTIEIWPFGNHEKREVLATAVVANDMTGWDFSGNYDVAVQDKDGIKTGRVEDFERKQGAVRLVGYAFISKLASKVSPARVALDRVLALRQAERLAGKAAAGGKGKNG